MFEITPQAAGRQSTLIGGGRYDGLVEQLGGAPTPGVGFGMGIERAIANVKGGGAAPHSEPRPKVLVAYVGDDARKAALRVSSDLRKGNVPAILAPSSRSLRSQLRYASSVGASHAVIIGEDELRRGMLTLRDMAKGEQADVVHDAEALARRIGGECAAS